MPRKKDTKNTRMCPQINRNRIKEKKVNYKRENKSTEFYNSMAWTRLRNTYLSLHPICECCLEHERVTPATDIHHRRPFLNGETKEERWNLFLDEKNLMALCEKCHYALHFKDKQYGLSSLDSLTETEYRYAHGLNH